MEIEYTQLHEQQRLHADSKGWGMEGVVRATLHFSFPFCLPPLFLPLHSHRTLLMHLHYLAGTHTVTTKYSHMYVCTFTCMYTCVYACARVHVYVKMRKKRREKGGGGVEKRTKEEEDESNTNIHKYRKA
mmetsp:Transcript_15222/g.38431  ORF Transcript_15222/g.38431 Transcript_15222/m.38431 type:complete len:130 (+) Transcript_15222:32-421(+)